jgi:hypothetical protein
VVASVVSWDRRIWNCSGLSAGMFAVPYTSSSAAAFLRAMLRLWCYRKTSRIIQDHLIIQIWIFNLNSWNMTRNS